MLPLEEFEFPTVEEMQSYYQMFWQPPRANIDPTDYFRIDAHRDNKNVKGNVCLLGVFFLNKDKSAQMFVQRSICCPFEEDLNLTRAQWWKLLQSGLAHREVYWCWLPSINREFLEHDPMEWRSARIVGWDIYEHRYPPTHDDDIIIGPDGIFTREQFDARQPAWKGIFMFQDITGTK